MTTPIGFDPASGTIIIMDNGVYPARSMMAAPAGTSPDHIQIWSLAHRGVQYLAWDDVTSLDGSYVPSSLADALAYLRGEFAKSSPVGETFGIPAVAGADLVRGQPVAVSRASGQLLPARADTYPLAFVAGLASSDTANGFANQPAHGAVTLPDWTTVTGSPSLSPGLPYFLAASGGLTSTPRLDTACVSRVGLATGPLTLVVEPSAPILL